MIEVMHHRMGGDGSTHTHKFLPEYIASEAKQMKKILQLPDDAPYFYCEDHAPGHYHDGCTVTKEQGLCAIRKKFFRDTYGWRKLSPKKATPRLGVGDQMHGGIRDEIHKELAQLAALSKDDLTKMPEQSLMRKGGLFITGSGYKRCPTLFLYCLAVAKVRATLRERQQVVYIAVHGGFF